VRAAKNWVSAHPWLAFIVRRAAFLVVSVLALALATFLMLQLIPGDPVTRIAGEDATPQSIEQLRRELGLDRPLWEQFTAYMGNLLTGDLGTSFQNGRPVGEIIADRLPVTATLAACSVALVLLISVPAGILIGSMTRGGRHRATESSFVTSTGIAAAIPDFVAGTLLALVFGVALRWLPVGGVGTAAAFVLPVIALSIRPVAVLSRIIRMETLNVLSLEYIRTAESKRLPPMRIYRTHVLPNVLTAALTVTGLLLGGLIGGAVTVENVFALPGLGTVVVQAVTVRDYPVIQGVMIVLGIAVLLINTFVDALVALLDPRSVLAN